MHTRASELDRIVNCPGSPAACRGIEQPPTSEEASEGTANHKMLETLITPENCLHMGEVLNEVDGVTWEVSYCAMEVAKIAAEHGGIQQCFKEKEY